MKLSTNTRSIAVMSASAVGILLLFVLILFPQTAKFIARQKELRSAGEKVARAEKRLALIPDVVREVEGLKKELAELESKTVRGDEIASAVEVLETEAYELGLAGAIVIQPLEDGEGGQGSDARKLSFRIELKCTFERLVKYLESLRNIPMLIAVEDISVGSEQVGDIYVETELRICTYTLQ